MKPLILILGRPNVGKSTLFNRLTGKKRALVYDEPGVTRDHQFGRFEWEGQQYEIADTAGVDLDCRDEFSKKMQARLKLDIKRASLLLLMMDGRDGLTPRDRDWYEFCRRYEKKLLLVINKMDLKVAGDNFGEFYDLGPKKIFPLSADRGTQMTDFLDEIVGQIGKIKPVAPEVRAPDERRFRISVIGRPNVGKSTLFNYLMQTERVMVDKNPGTTRDPVNEEYIINGEAFWLTDTAGIRRRGTASTGLERISISKTISVIESSDAVLCLLDGVEGITKQDAHVCHEVIKRNKPMLLLVNKWDVAAKIKTKKAWLDEQIIKLGFTRNMEFLFISGKTGYGVSQIFPKVKKMRHAMKVHITTSQFNKLLAEIIAGNPLSMYRGRLLKIYYGTQVEGEVPSFVLFANEPKGITEAYRRYIMNSLQEALGIKHIPIRIQWRKRS